LEQNIHGLTHPPCITETIQQLIDDDEYVIPHPAHLKDEAKGGEGMLQAAHAAESTDEDVVGETVGSYLVRAFTDHPVEAGDSELGG
jgi:hypothetical protein